MRWFLISLFCISGLIVNAQDWIIKTSGDTIHCKIVEVDGLQITFLVPPKRKKHVLSQTQIERYEITDKETLLPDWAQEEPKLSSSSFPVDGNEKKDKSSNKGFRIGTVIGFSYLLAPVSDNTPSSLVKHTKKLKAGFNVKADVLYFLGSYFGMGPKYSLFKSHASTSSYPGFSAFTFTNDLTLHLIGGHFTSRFSSKNKAFRFMGGISVGYARYQDKYANGFQSSTLTADAFGFSLDFDLDIRLYKSIYFGITLDFIDVSLSENSYGKGQNGEPNDLTRVDLSGGLRVYL
jgi:hypothetical protein